MLTLAFLIAMAFELCGGLVGGIGIIALGMIATNDITVIRAYAVEAAHLGKAELLALSMAAAIIGIGAFIIGLSIADRVIAA